jgi:hypothetical protein
MPSCGLMIAATTVSTAARSGRSRHSSRSPSSRKTTPTASTCPQTTESNQVIGFATTSAPPNTAARRPAPSSRAIAHTTQPSAMSDRMAGTLMRSLIPPIA